MADNPIAPTPNIDPAQLAASIMSRMQAPQGSTDDLENRVAPNISAVAAARQGAGTDTPAARPMYADQHPNIATIVNGLTEALKQYGQSKQDPRVMLQMRQQDISQQLAKAMMGFRQANLTEQERHHGATEATSEQNADTRSVGTLGRLGLSQEHQDWLESKVAQTKVVPDDKSPTKASLVLLDAEGNEVGRLAGYPPSGMLPTVRTSTENHITRDPISGAIMDTPVTNTSTSQKVLPGMTGSSTAAGTGGTPAAPAAPAAGAGAGAGKTRVVGQGAFPTTSTTRTMFEAAPQVKRFTTEMRGLLDQFQAQGRDLGPIASRWNDLYQGTIGADDPLFAKLGVDYKLLSTLMMRMHAGARGGTLLIPHFESMFDVTKQTPDNLRGAFQEMEQYADSLMQEGQAALNGKSPYAAGQPGTPGAPNANAPKSASDYLKKLGIH